MRSLVSLAAAAVLLVPLTLADAQTPKPAQPAPAKPQQQTQPPAPPPVAPAKPYKVIAVKPPKPLGDAAFDAFRKQLGEIVQKKDRAALAKLVVAKDFFWEGENGDKADKKKSGIDNLAAAVNLAAKDGIGWDILGSYAAEPTAQPLPDRAGVICSPADPDFDDAELEEVAKATGTDPGEWGFPTVDGIDVRAEAKPKSEVTEKLGMHFVRVLPDMTPPASPTDIPMIKIVTPSGKTGFVSGDALSPLGNDQMCFVKDGANWKIAGFIGGD
jgi:hypothetical protein